MSATRLPSARRIARNAAWIVVLLAAMLAFLSSCARPGSPREKMVRHEDWLKTLGH